ncbi:MAG: MFS transporter [Parachlamydiales bacterium]|nr:MFS transporter [Parachlamydiales bacterium]
MFDNDREFSRIRSFLWPIHRHELAKFVPMILIFFLISFNYNLLRITKDALIITAPGSGAEAIPFLKVWAVLPMAIFTTFLFTKMASRFHREHLFYVVVSLFLLFFSLFIFVLYPNKEHLYLNSISDSMTASLPPGFKGIIAVIRYWIYSLYYVMAESWSTIVLSILLWGFANQVTEVDEAKRFYALFGIGINFASVIAGELCSSLAFQLHKPNISLHPTAQFLGAKTHWDQTLLIFVSIILLSGLVIIALYRYLHTFVLKDRAAVKEKFQLIKKEKTGLIDSIKLIAQSKYLLQIALIVLCYNVVINLTEVLWKSQLKELYPKPGEYTAYMSRITSFIGMCATFTSMFISGNIIRRLGWKFAALIPPIIISVAGIGFFFFFSIKEYSSLIVVLGTTPLAITVFFGSMQNIFSRAAKYTVFDDTKEMAFIPLDPIQQLKGKAAIDGIGSRLGKSGSSLILQIFLIFFTTPASYFPMIILVLCMVIPIWIKAINNLAKKFSLITAEKAVANAQALQQKSSQVSMEQKSTISH